MKHLILFLTLSLIGLTPTMTHALANQKTFKTEQSTRTFRSVKLGNELEVLLVHDAKVKKSAAAMDVRVGSMADPVDHLGLAHFLEHMLFLGTKKYPKVGEYNDYLKENQGFSNAYTASESTNYYFEVNHNAFEGALDRFAQFFIAPTFDEKFVEREMNAVHSEYQKNLLSDGWRRKLVLESLIDKNHPKHQFNIGNLETLKNVDQKVLQSFYRKHYSANVMKLTLLSRTPIEEQEKLVLKYFNEIMNYKIKAPNYSSSLYEKDKLPLKVEIIPVKESQELSLYFPIPNTDEFVESKPTTMLAHLIGHEGKGSLLSYLKKQGLATSLSTYARTDSFGGYFIVHMDVTKKGLEDESQVISSVLSYIKLLEKEGYRKYIFEEKKSLSQTNFRFRDLEEGGDWVSYYASMMQIHPALEIDDRVRLVTKYSKANFDRFLSLLRPENMIVVASHKGVKAQKTEPFLGAEYSVKKLTKSRVKSFTDVKPIKQLSYPEPNPYIPSDFKILDNEKSVKPKMITKKSTGEFWFQQDQTFKLPKAKLNLQILSLAPSKSPKDRILTSLYVTALNEKLNEWKYVLNLAGLELDLEDYDGGIIVRLSGFSHHFTDALTDAFERMLDVSIDQSVFNDIKAKIHRQLKSREVDAAYKQALYELKYLTNPRSYHYRDYIDLLKDTSLAEVKKYKSRLFSKVGLIGAAYGNLKGKDIEAALKKLHKVLGAEKLPRKKWPLSQTIRLKNGSQVGMAKVNKTNNGAWVDYSIFGKRNAKNEIFTKLAAAHVNSSFYTELRTRQQLGYVVATLMYPSRTTTGLAFIVQSGTHATVDVAKRANEWKSAFAEELGKLKDEEFETYKQGVLDQLVQEPTTVDEKLGEIFTYAVLLDGKLDYREQLISQLKSLEKADYSKKLGKFLKGEKGNRMVFYVAKNGQKQPKPLEKEVKNPEEFKRKAEVW